VGKEQREKKVDLDSKQDITVKLAVFLGFALQEEHLLYLPFFLQLSIWQKQDEMDRWIDAQMDIWLLYI
jgi:hypothetical protein